jgi:phenylacetate-CoA ligase
LSSPPFAAGLREISRTRKWLEASQWWPAAELQRWQMRRLARLLAHARRDVPFYAQRLAGIAPGAEALTLEQWRSLPRLTKALVRQRSSALRSRAHAADPSLARRSTSGSTAEPLSLVKEMRPRLALWAAKLRAFDWWNTDYRGKTVMLRALKATDPHGTVLRYSNWGTPLKELHQTGEYVMADVFMSIERQLELLEAEQPQYLVTFPTNLRLLLRAARKAGRRVPSLRYVQTLGEVIDPDLRGECRSTLGVPLYDVYGSMEADQIAVQCPSHEHYHVHGELNFVEVLAEDGRACEPGETGRVVVTPLHAFAMPLVRYDLDDFAEVGGPCPCGRGLPVLTRILGRRQGQLTLPSGDKRIAVWGSRVFGSISAVRQFQIVQTSLSAVEARIVLERALAEEERARIVSGLGNQLGPGFDVTLKVVDAIPRSPGGKLMEFVSEL